MIKYSRENGDYFETETVEEMISLLRHFKDDKSDADDGWIEWNGGENPPVSDDAEVEVKYRRGDKRSNYAHTFAWFHDGPSHECGDIDIVAYRIVEAG